MKTKGYLTESTQPKSHHNQSNGEAAAAVIEPWMLQLKLPMLLY